MEKVIQVIKKVIDSDLLIKELCIIPDYGVDDSILKSKNYFKDYGQIETSAYITFLKKWNGMDVDVIKFHGLSHKEGIPEIHFDQEHSLLIIASDPAGFLYGMDKKGNIYSVDTDFNTKKYVSRSFEEFILQFIFGIESKEFLGNDWYLQLNKLKIID